MNHIFVMNYKLAQIHEKIVDNSNISHKLHSGGEEKGCTKIMTPARNMKKIVDFKHSKETSPIK